ncbi:PREDICTED: uncharacterized protein LOC104594784 isoform X2 [Nelumbo nucifera]|uniref:Uncharacterized protein n=2 Tax=Nelumbo nucifera TaxID=4432 RepID=A0A822Y468_NELNU|nr:PREDICTED: uncharacterized protein LOC104594784 isoform X2 [Nelumbo nucifera]DAD26099.1 TPA_asm: hypothetical protein HUJ06_027567 [Nelumbo nucifera]
MAKSAAFHLLRSQTKQLTSKNFQAGYYACRFGTWQHTIIKQDFRSGMHHIVPRRWASRAAAVENDSKISIGPHKGREAGDGKDTGIVYYGPISSTIKKVLPPQQRFTGL